MKRESVKLEGAGSGRLHGQRRVARLTRALRGRAHGLRAATCAALALAAFSACGNTSPERALPVGTLKSLPRSRASHVIVITLENKEYGAVIGSSDAPYVNRLAHRFGLATRSYAQRHPSLPNYLALTSGSTHGITSDCTDCRVSAPNVAEQMQRARISWKAYLEGMPQRCFKGASSGRYVKKHNPFAYYQNVIDDPSSCRRLVPYTELGADLRAGRLPTYAWISPDLCDDTHDCGVSSGDRFLSHLVPALLHELGPHGFLILTWDEGTSDQGCCAGAHGGHVATIVAGPGVRRGAESVQPVDHNGVLRTIEDALMLPPLAAATSARSGTLAPLFLTPPRIRATAPGR